MGLSQEILSSWSSTYTKSVLDANQPEKLIQLSPHPPRHSMSHPGDEMSRRSSWLGHGTEHANSKLPTHSGLSTTGVCHFDFTEKAWLCHINEGPYDRYSVQAFKSAVWAIQTRAGPIQERPWYLHRKIGFLNSTAGNYLQCILRPEFFFCQDCTDLVKAFSVFPVIIDTCIIEAWKIIPARSTRRMDFFFFFSMVLYNPRCRSKNSYCEPGRLQVP